MDRLESLAFSHKEKKKVQIRLVKALKISTFTKNRILKMMSTD